MIDKKKKKSGIDFTTKARLMFLVIISLLLLSSIFPVKAFINSGGFENLLNQYVSLLASNSGKNSPSAKPNIPTASATVKPTANPSVGPTVKATSKPVAKECYRYRVVHLDESSSYLCYTKNDYLSLRDFGHDYSSAKTFYEFHLEGAARSQELYDRTGSSIYLDAKASSEANAAREKEKMNIAVGKMQEIEKRGY